MDLLIDMGQMRMKPWKPIMKYWKRIKFVPSHFSVPTSSTGAHAQFEGFIRAYTSPVRPPEARFSHQNGMFFQDKS